MMSQNNLWLNRPPQHMRYVNRFAYLGDDQPDPLTNARCKSFGRLVCTGICPRHMPTGYSIWASRHALMVQFVRINP